RAFRLHDDDGAGLHGSKLIVQMTGGPTSWRNRPQNGGLHPAALHGEGAAGVEMTAGWGMQGRGNFALDRREGALPGIQPRHLLEERTGVWMVRLREEFFGRRHLHD